MNDSNREDQSPAEQPEELDREELVTEYLDTLPFDPYPVQEEALLAWFTSKQGVLVCAPTGTGKTVIAEAAIFEALKTGKRAYYTTPLIALTEQKLIEIRESVVRWGYSADDVGLVTGNRRVNPDAPILVVVAEILFNRLLHGEAFRFDDVSAVVMDEFHSFNDPERGIVWELSLGLLPEHVRLLLLSATVGNAYPFTSWLRTSHDRNVELVEGHERKVPLSYRWIGDLMLNELVQQMVAGDDTGKRVPSLIFCFNREQCWSVAELLKGQKVISDDHKKQLSQALDQYDWSQGAGPKLKQILMRGIGVHHAGILPTYKRIVEDLFQRKLLMICVCTETLAAGINLPARSVVLPSILKGPKDKKKLIAAADAHQMFGRAGRPQYDTEGFVYALAHEDDVKLHRWQEKYDSIPEDTKDPGLMKAKKALKKKKPKRRTTEQYWSEEQFEQLRTAPSGNLESRGHLPWRLLAYMLDASPEVSIIRRLINKRLLSTAKIEAGQKELNRMLITLWTAGYVKLIPEPPRGTGEPQADEPDEPPAEAPRKGLFEQFLEQEKKKEAPQQAAPEYNPELAEPTETLPKLLNLRGVNPLYGVFLVNQLGIADEAERIQAFESLLQLPYSVGKGIRVPSQDQLPNGPLASLRLDERLLKLGLATAEELGAKPDEPEEEEPRRGWQMFEEDRVFVLTLADKLKRLFDHDFPGVQDVRVNPVWVCGELLEFGGDFNKYITSKGLQKQEGMIFRHVLRMILLLGEFLDLTPPETDDATWKSEISSIRDRLTQCCQQIDPTSTDKMLSQEN